MLPVEPRQTPEPFPRAEQIRGGHPRVRRRGSGWFGKKRNRRRAEASRARAALAAIRRQARAGLVLCLFVGLAGAAVGIGRYLLRSPHFAVRALRLAPTQHISSETLALRAQSVLGMNLFRVDLDSVRRDLAEEPWVAEVRVRRELPSTIAIDVVEREAACAVALGPLYLVDGRGLVFKRATTHEALGLPVVTGIDRARYLADPTVVAADLRAALGFLAVWQKAGSPDGG